MRLLAVNILLLFCLGTLAFAQASPERIVPAELRAQQIGGKEIHILLRQDIIYLPALETFSFLGIKNTYDSTEGTVRGIFKSSDVKYEINLRKNTAELQGNKVTLQPDDYAFADSILFLRLEFINLLFKLDISYSPRRLQVLVKNSADLPAVVVARRLHGLSRRAIQQRLPAPELSLGRDFTILSGGHIDWSTTTNFSRTAYLGSRDNLYFGVKALGADFTGRYFGNLSPGRNSTTFRGNIRYPIFNASWLRQIVYGDIVNLGVMPQEITGLEITNRPAAVRRFFTREVFSGVVEPKMNVSISSGLSDVNFEQTGDEGLYQFDVPMLYGNGLMEIKAFDSWGQEQTLRYRLTIPRTLIPPGEAEYSISGGNLQGVKNTKAASGSVNWGLSPDLTLGAKMSYYDFRSPTKFFPGLNATARLARNIIFAGSVVPNAFSDFSFDWEFPSTARFVLQNTHYGANTVFNPSAIINDMNATISLPFRSQFNAYVLNLFGSQTVYTGYRNDEIQASVSVTIQNFSPTLSTRFVSQNVYGDGRSTIAHQSDIGVAFLLPAGVNVRSDVMYDHLQSQFQSVNVIAAKHITQNFQFSLSYYRFLNPSFYNLGLQLSYFFPFARVQGGVSTTGSDFYQYTATGTGSIDFNMINPSVAFSGYHGNILGNAGFVVRPFLDENGDGVKEKDEAVLDIGRVVYTNTDFLNQAYTMPVNRINHRNFYGYERYNLYLDASSLENPIWVPQFNGIQVLSEPNYVRRIDIPILSGGVLRGTIMLEGKTPAPAEGIGVILTPADSLGGGTKKIGKNVLKASTFSTGEFEFIAVPPGTYILTPDPVGLKNLLLRSTPERREITVKITKDGDMISDQNFTLSP